MVRGERRRGSRPVEKTIERKWSKVAGAVTFRNLVLEAAGEVGQTAVAVGVELQALSQALCIVGLRRMERCSHQQQSHSSRDVQCGTDGIGGFDHGGSEERTSAS